MRFKLNFNDQKKCLEINCLKSTGQDIILPDDPAQHVYFPIPINLKKRINDKLINLIDKDDELDFLAINDEIKALTNKRKELLNSLRSSTNPKIMEACEKFREDHAEHFI